MIKATLKRNGQVFSQLELPKSLSEVPLNRFIDFLVECRKLGNENENQFMVMSRAISEFCASPLAEIIQAEIGDVYMPEVSGLDGSIRNIFGYITTLIGAGKGELLTPETAGFEYMNETYRMPIIMQQALAGEYRLPAMTVIETVEAAEIQRFKVQKTQMSGDPNGELKRKIMDIANAEVFQMAETDDRRLAVMKAGEQLVKMETERAGDPSGSLLYTMYLKMLAVICRKEGEHLPVDDAEREAWINDRAVHFRRIDAQTALNVDFFLTNTLGILDDTLPAVGFLSRQSFVLMAAIRLKSKRRTKGRATRTKKFLGV